MDPRGFDTLARAWASTPSRRGLNRAVAALVLGGLFGRLLLPDQTAAKHHKKHKKKHQSPTSPPPPGSPPSPPCVPQDPVALCGEGCGTRTNNCGQTVVCATCPASQTCLLNGTCATTCPPASNCPAGCSCGYGTTENLAQRCIQIPPELTCAALQSCSSTAQCPQGEVCLYTNCGSGSIDAPRCVPVCPCASCPGNQTCGSSGTCVDA